MQRHQSIPLRRAATESHDDAGARPRRPQQRPDGHSPVADVVDGQASFRRSSDRGGSNPELERSPRHGGHAGTPLGVRQGVAPASGVRPPAGEHSPGTGGDRREPQQERCEFGPLDDQRRSAATAPPRAAAAVEDLRRPPSRRSHQAREKGPGTGPTTEPRCTDLHGRAAGPFPLSPHSALRQHDSDGTRCRVVPPSVPSVLPIRSRDHAGRCSDRHQATCRTFSLHAATELVGFVAASVLLLAMAFGWLDWFGYWLVEQVR